MSTAPRLHVTPDLAEGAAIAIEGDQAHYLTRVLRLGVGDGVRVFNGRDGEFAARIASASKNGAHLEILERTRKQQSPPDLWLLFAPLKKARTDFVVEKAVELGVAEIWPVLTERTDAETVRVERLARIAQEAAEQTERLDAPPVREARKLAQVLADWPAERMLIFADESGDDMSRPWGGDTGRARTLEAVLREAADGPAAILIGPEGGFAPGERQRLRSLPYVRAVGLGPRILRAETAAVAAITLWQAIRGDWR